MTVGGRTILQVIPALDAGGAERTVIEVVEALTRAGARALVASAGGRLEADLAAAGGELLRLPKAGSKSPLVLWGNARLLAKAIRREKVDIVHARSRAPAWSALWAARRTGAAFVTTYHGVYSGRGALKTLYNSVMARGAVVIANSDFTAAHVRKAHPFAASRIVTIDRGVDVAAFDPAAVTQDRIAALAQAWGLSRGGADGMLWLLPGRLTSWKGQAVAVAALAHIAREGRLGDGWRLVLAGDAQGRDGYVAELKTAISNAGLDERVLMVGHCSDMPAAFALADFVLAPSTRPEAFGRVAAEAGAMGRPVIASDLGAQRDVVVDGVTGHLARPGDAASLAGAMQLAAAASSAARAAMGAAARRRVLEKYTKAALQTATLDVYRRVLAGAP